MYIWTDKEDIVSPILPVISSAPLSSVLTPLWCKRGQIGCNSGPGETGSICSYVYAFAFPIALAGARLTLIKQIDLKNISIHHCHTAHASMPVCVGGPREANCLFAEKGADVGRLIWVWQQNHARKEGSLITHLTSHLQAEQMRENTHKWWLLQSILIYILFSAFLHCLNFHLLLSLFVFGLPQTWTDITVTRSI